jgi:dGTPase
MTSDISEATNELRAYLFKNVYTHPVAKAEDAKSQDLLASLFEYFKENPEKMPKLYFDNIERDGIGRCVCDYISGMTDRYAIQVYQNIFVPKTWQGGNT